MFRFGETLLIDAEHHGDAEIEQISIYGIAHLKTVNFTPKTSAVFCLPSACGASVRWRITGLLCSRVPTQTSPTGADRQRSAGVCHHTVTLARKFLKVDSIFCRRMQIRICAACHSHPSSVMRSCRDLGRRPAAAPPQAAREVTA